VILTTFFVLWLVVTVASAQCISVSIPFEFSGIVAEGDSVCYEFVAPRDGEITATLTPADSDEDPDLYVYVGELVTHIGSSINGRGDVDSVTFSVAAGVTFTVEVYGFSGGEDDIVSYELEIAYTSAASVATPPPTCPDPNEPNDDRDSARDIYVGGHYEGCIDPNDRDWFKLNLYRTPANVVFDISAEVPITFIVYHPLGYAVCDVEDTTGTSLLCDNLDMDVYYVFVWSEYSGEYEFDVRGYAIPTPAVTPTTTPTEQPIGVAPTQPSPIESIIESIRNVGSQFWNWLSQQSRNIQTIPQNIQPIIDQIRNAGGEFWNWLSQQPQNIQIMVYQGVSQAINNTIAIFTTPVNMIKDAVTTIFDTITSAVTQAINYITQPILSVFQAIGNVFRGIAETINSVVRSVFGFGGTQFYAPLTVTEVIAT